MSNYAEDGGRGGSTALGLMPSPQRRTSLHLGNAAIRTPNAGYIEKDSCDYQILCISALARSLAGRPHSSMTNLWLHRGFMHFGVLSD